MDLNLLRSRNNHSTASGGLQAECALTMIVACSCSFLHLRPLSLQACSSQCMQGATSLSSCAPRRQRLRHAHSTFIHPSHMMHPVCVGGCASDPHPAEALQPVSTAGTGTQPQQQGGHGQQQQQCWCWQGADQACSRFALGPGPGQYTRHTGL